MAISFDVVIVIFCVLRGGSKRIESSYYTLYVSMFICIIAMCMLDESIGIYVCIEREGGICIRET